MHIYIYIRMSPNPINHLYESRRSLVRSLPGFGSVLVQKREVLIDKLLVRIHLTVFR